jgi:hypothetical protein
MVLLLIFIAVSKTLVFEGLTLLILWDWFIIHPFCFIFFICEILSYTIAHNYTDYNNVSK